MSHSFSRLALVFSFGGRGSREDAEMCKQVSSLFESSLLLLPNSESVWADMEEGHNAINHVFQS